MKHVLFATTFLFTFGFQSESWLLGDEGAATLQVPVNKTSKTNQDSTGKGKEKEEQSQQAAWMLESAKSANDYVDALDREYYDQSWTKGDQIFQHTITKEEWTKALIKNRKPLGKVNSRKLKDQRPAMDPQGLPRGAYMVVEYDTSFENAPSSGELLTLRRGSDGAWRVLTYQVN